MNNVAPLKLEMLHFQGEDMWAYIMADWKIISHYEKWFNIKLTMLIN